MLGAVGWFGLTVAKWFHACFKDAQQKNKSNGPKPFTHTPSNEASNAPMSQRTKEARQVGHHGMAEAITGVSLPGSSFKLGRNDEWIELRRARRNHPGRHKWADN